MGRETVILYDGREPVASFFAEVSNRVELIPEIIHYKEEAYTFKTARDGKVIFVKARNHYLTDIEMDRGTHKLN